MRAGLHWPARILSALTPVAAGLALAAGPAAPAAAQVQMQAVAGVAAGQGLDDFYDARDERPLWFSQPGRQAAALIEILHSAEVDGLEPGKYRLGEVEKAVQAAMSGKAKAVRRADKVLSHAPCDVYIANTT